jgi:hypothetical protein
MTAKEFREAFDAATAWLPWFDKGDAAAIAQQLIDDVVAALRRDPRWASIPRAALELLLADVRCRLEDQLHAELHDWLPGDKALERVARAAAEMASETEDEAA